MNIKTAIKNVADVPNKFNVSGGTVNGNITFPNDTYLMWNRNTDHAKISFKNTSDSDTDSYMHFVTGDNGNEYFKFSSINGNTTTDWLTIKSDHLRFKGNSVYHTAYKPSANDVGALSISGGTVNGSITSTVLNITDANGYRHNSLGAGDNHVIGVASGIVYLGNPGARTQIEGNSDPTVLVGNKTYTMYHTGNFNPDSKLSRGLWTTNGGQDLIVHNKRALVGESNGTLHLGYGGDFSNIKCGNNYTVWHSGNFTPRLTWDDSNSRISVDRGVNNARVYYADLAGNADRINSKNITISQTAPSNPSTGDLWISW